MPQIYKETLMQNVISVKLQCNSFLEEHLWGTAFSLTKFYYCFFKNS